MPLTAGNCPICTHYFEGLHDHHVIPRELTLNGIKGHDGPRVYLCGSCHDALHRQAKSDIAQTGKLYFTDQQRIRADPYLRVLTAALQLNEKDSTSRQMQKIVLQFDTNQMERLHALKKDHNATNLAKFLESIVLSFLNRS